MKRLAQIDGVVKPEPVKAEERRRGINEGMGETRVVKPKPITPEERQRGINEEAGSDRQSR